MQRVKLTEMLRAGGRFTVQTPFENYNEVPERLKSVLDLDKHRSRDWVNFQSGAFVVGSIWYPL